MKLFFTILLMFTASISRGDVGDFLHFRQAPILDPLETFKTPPPNDGWFLWDGGTIVPAEVARRIPSRMYDIRGMGNTLFLPDMGVTDGLSGAAYNPLTGTVLLVRNVAGLPGDIYEVDVHGTVVRAIVNSNFSDTEAIEWLNWDAVNNCHIVAIVEENNNQRITIARLTNAATTLNRSASGNATYDTTLAAGGSAPDAGNYANEGVEAIAYDSFRGVLYYMAEKPRGGQWWIYTMKVADGVNASLCDCNATLITAGVLTDVSDMHYDVISDSIYLLSDESNKVVQISRSGVVLRELALTGWTQPEGLSFDPTMTRMYVCGEPQEFGVYDLGWSQSAANISGHVGFRIVTNEPQMRVGLSAGGNLLVVDNVTTDVYFDVAKTVNIGGLVTYSGSTIQRPTVTIDNAAQNQHVFVINADDVEIHHLRITGAQQLPQSAPWSVLAGNHTGIYIARYEPPVASTGQRCSIYNCEIDNLWMGIYSPGAVTAGEVLDLRVEKNNMHSFSHSGVYLLWYHHGARMLNNRVSFKRPTDTHIAHPSYAPGAGNCLYAGFSNDVQMVSNNLNGSYCRWGGEVFHCDDSEMVYNRVWDCGSGLSVGGGSSNTASFNTISGADGGAGTVEVGSMEFVGLHHVGIGNRIRDGGKSCKVGIAINPYPEGTQVTLSGNDIGGVQYGIQFYNNGLGTAQDCLIDANTFYLNTRAAEDSVGVYFNNSGLPADLSRNVVTNNMFIGNSNIASSKGCIQVLDTSLIYAKRNTQRAQLQVLGMATETATVNGLVFISGTSSVITDDANTVQTAAGFTNTGTNTRIVMP